MQIYDFKYIDKKRMSNIDSESRSVSKTPKISHRSAYIPEGQENTEKIGKTFDNLKNSIASSLKKDSKDQKLPLVNSNEDLKIKHMPTLELPNNRSMESI